MTRQERIFIISRAFNADVKAHTSYWNCAIETDPKRSLFLSANFVAKNIDQDGISASEFQALLDSLDSAQWRKKKDGSLQYFMRQRA